MKKQVKVYENLYLIYDKFDILNQKEELLFNQVVVWKEEKSFKILIMFSIKRSFRRVLGIIINEIIIRNKEDRWILF